MTSNRQYLPWLMWFFPLAFFGFQFILRLFPGLVMPEFLVKFNISATDFGWFASLYYLGYAGMQIPMALLLDKYGPRNVISLSAMLCAVAVWLLLFFDSWPIAMLSRFLIGVGSVVGFLGTSKVISQWFTKERYARLVGLTFSFGLLGALYGGRPVSMMIESMGWEKVLGLLGVVAFLLGLFNFSFVRNKVEQQIKPEPILASLKQLISHRSLLILAFANFLMVGALEGFADVWGVPFLMAARDLSKVDAASITSCIFVGMLFGGPLLAYFSEKFKAHYLVTMISGFLMAMLMACVLFFNQELSQSALMIIMFCIGLLCCYQVIVFAIGAELVPAPLMSITIAFLNCINMLGGSFFHSAIGNLMDFFEQGTVIEGVKTYSLESYVYTLALIPIASLLGATLVWFSKRKSMRELTRQEKVVV
ncbi:MAG: MFS transporter [Gammaproteobacteria bacterium]|nr:MFS transporter [Gammaproteobacteria bacterium]